MDLPEKFQVMSVIEKLPKPWEEFALSLKRQKGEITWTNLMLDISVNEQHKSKQGHVMPTEAIVSKVNIVTVGQKRKFNKKAGNKTNDKNKAKKPKANKPCWSCGQVGHWSKECPNKKAKKSEMIAQTNTVSGAGVIIEPMANMVIGEASASVSNDGFTGGQ